MLELNVQAAPGYIARRFGMDPATLTAVELGGGISNHVVLVEAQGLRLVVKQSLPRLRVQEDWFSDRERIFRESQALIRLGTLLPRGWLPEVLFEDREHFAYAMTAAPVSAISWKQLLLAGNCEPSVAENVARIQAAIMRLTWQSDEWESAFGDLTVFRQLRLDPYYEVAASRNADLAPNFAAAVARCRNQRFCLVHGDWSPKNIMVDAGAAMAIDFEVVHYGDPSFDSAFLLNHLILKCCHSPQSTSELRGVAVAYWNELLRSIPEAANILHLGTLQHLPLLLLARLDGKSPVEYIQDEQVKRRIRSFARDLLRSPANSIPSVFERL